MNVNVNGRGLNLLGRVLMGGAVCHGLMPATFSAELAGRRVVDSRGDLLGVVADLLIDSTSGNVLGLLLDLDAGLDAGLLPWPVHGTHLLVPTDEVAAIDEDIHLLR